MIEDFVHFVSGNEMFILFALSKQKEYMDKMPKISKNFITALFAAENLAKRNTNVINR